MYFNLRRLFDIEDAQKKERFLDNFFKQFSNLTMNHNTYKLGNKFILDWFIETENLYIKFKKSRKVEHWEDFWKQLVSLKRMIEEEYWKNFDSLYGEYLWFQRTLTSNIFIRLWHELLYILFQASQFTVLISLITVFYSIWDYVFIKTMSNDMILSSSSFLLLSITLYGFLMIIGADIVGFKNQRESFTRKLGKKYTPKVINYWDKAFLRSSKKIEIPDMYNRRQRKDE